MGATREIIGVTNTIINKIIKDNFIYLIEKNMGLRATALPPHLFHFNIIAN